MRAAEWVAERGARALRACAPALLAGALLGPGSAPARAQEGATALPASSLAVRRGERWDVWWRAEAAPASWPRALPAVAGAVEWRRARPGVEWAELVLAGESTAWRMTLVLVRLDPRRVSLSLASATRDAGLRAAWTVDSLAAGAALAVNAGQFTGGSPWGWVVRGGREVQPPGRGPLSAALVVDGAGRARIVPADSISEVRRRGEAVEAFQSYPTLLTGEGAVPAALTAPGRGVDLEHRDARLGVGELRDGRILLALTRFAGLGGVLSQLPFGPTTPEMAAIMGALGCRRAVLLDGGLSSQLALRDAAGRVQAWAGLRAVPLALVAAPRAR